MSNAELSKQQLRPYDFRRTEPMADPEESPSLSLVPGLKPAIGIARSPSHFIHQGSHGLPTPHVQKQQDMRREKFMNLLNEDVRHAGFKLT